jgi:hypothetical protein
MKNTIEAVQQPAPTTTARLTRAGKRLRDPGCAGLRREPFDRGYSLDQIVEAHQYVDTGRKKGNVVISIA